MPDELVTIARFRDLPEALLAKGKLQAEGVECWLVDENMVRMDWFWANAIGGMRMQVREEDAERARASLADPTPERIEDAETAEVYEQPKCPQCVSLRVSFGTHDSGWKLALLQFGLPMPSFRRRFWKCENCGARWDGEP